MNGGASASASVWVWVWVWASQASGVVEGRGRGVVVVVVEVRSGDSDGCRGGCVDEGSGCGWWVVGSGEGWMDKMRLSDKEAGRSG